MKIAILSSNKALYTTKRMCKVARDMGHVVVVYDPSLCSLYLGDGSSEVYLKGRKLKDIDVILPRIGSSFTDHALAVVQHFEMMKIPVINSSEAIARSKNKLRCLQLLVSAGLKVPTTIVAKDLDLLVNQLKLVDGPPVVFKTVHGTHGVGVILVEDLPKIESTVDTLWGLGQNFMIQKFISEAQGQDIRVLVVGGKIVGAMKRRAREGEFRSNIHQGGDGIPMVLTSQQSQIALKATKVLGLEIAGVDMIESHEGPLVIEVNSSPGFEGLEKATKMDIASEIIEYVVVTAKKKKDKSL